MTIADIEEIFLEQMPGFYDREEVKAIACLAVQHVLNVNRSYYMLHKNTDLTLVQETALIRILDELRFGKPVQHVIGEADFYGLRFKVNSSVLVPRPETEELVEWVIRTITAENSLSCCVLDIGTGTGCIPIAIKKNLPLTDVYAIDISQNAINTALENCKFNDAEVRIERGDILDPAFRLDGKSTFKIIVSNPPYVQNSEKALMQDHVLQHEPHEALFVEDSDPLIFYRSIADFSRHSLEPDGFLFLEINEALGPETCSLVESFGFVAELRKDLQGKDRMIKARKLSG